MRELIVPQLIFTTPTLSIFLLFAGTSDAVADLTVCNKSRTNANVAIAYKNLAATGKNITVEGWWMLPAGQCETLTSSPLTGYQYYVHATEIGSGGSWSGSVSLCTTNKRFSLAMPEHPECRRFGYDVSNFFPINSGQHSNWTVNLGDETSPDTPPTGGVLAFDCEAERNYETTAHMEDGDKVTKYVKQKRWQLEIDETKKVAVNFHPFPLEGAHRFRTKKDGEIEIHVERHPGACIAGPDPDNHDSESFYFDTTLHAVHYIRHAECYYIGKRSFTFDDEWIGACTLR